ncbi:hypothetical protein EHYA_03784 [Embleya hyalina]|uniref:Uncharacterized protein n=1 Tax=Embleya hyalina TaxID=516124 RepID=A0A401YNA9_9ACTN|nr:hypothetical protein EHYA_03784 [Embleya hyalina]
MPTCVSPDEVALNRAHPEDGDRTGQRHLLTSAEAERAEHEPGHRLPPLFGRVYIGIGHGDTLTSR